MDKGQALTVSFNGNVLVRHHLQPFSAIYEGLKSHIQDPGLHKKKLIE